MYYDDFLLVSAAMKGAKTFMFINEIGYWRFIDTNTSVTSGVYELEENRL